MFEKGTNNLNQFTLFEVLAQHYASGQKSLQFPDFSRVQVRSIRSKAGEPGRTFDLETAFRFTNCAANVGLEWGDLIELPEQDHAMSTPWSGLPESAKNALKQCLRKQVSIIVKGQTNPVVLTPELVVWNSGFSGRLPPSSLPGGPGGIQGAVLPSAGVRAEPERPAPIELTAQRLNDVVRGANVIRSSSDLTRVKVTRAGPAPADRQEMVFDLVRMVKANDLWLRDGDVIEVPEKP